MLPTDALGPADIGCETRCRIRIDLLDNGLQKCVNWYSAGEVLWLGWRR